MRSIIYFLHCLFFAINLFIKISGSQNSIFLSPKKDFVKINDTISIICRTKKVNMKDFVYKRKGAIIVYKCVPYYTLPLKLACGYSGDWYYMNATIPIVTWAYRGEYECIVNNKQNKVYLNVTVPAKVDILISHVSYHNEQEIKESGNEGSKMKGKGTLVSPYDLRNVKIKAVEMTCSSNCSYPPPSYTWKITSLSSPNRVSLPLTAMTADNVPCKSQYDEGMAKSSSLVKIDCLEQKLTGIQYLECNPLGNSFEDDITQKVYVFCPESKSNRSRLTSKNMQLKVTTGEMINIIVGCSIGVILLVSGIILICKHRSKDDMDQYTMRQNSIDHSGYRV